MNTEIIKRKPKEYKGYTYQGMFDSTAKDGSTHWAIITDPHGATFETKNCANGIEVRNTVHKLVDNDILNT